MPLFSDCLGWFSVYTFLNALDPGSFADAGATLTGDMQPSKVLYFNLTTLTTLGFGDIVPTKTPARMVPSREAASGVLYIAITMARLGAAYQIPNHDE